MIRSRRAKGKRKRLLARDPQQLEHPVPADVEAVLEKQGEEHVQAAAHEHVGVGGGLLFCVGFGHHNGSTLLSVVFACALAKAKGRNRLRYLYYKPPY